MPLPRWLARLNRRTFNRWNLRKGNWPIMAHVGRRTGTIHRTPLGAAAVDGGYVFVINYDAEKCDWVQNILASGRSSLRIDGEDVELRNPRVITKVEAVALAPETLEPPPDFMKVDEYLWMDAV